MKYPALALLGIILCIAQALAAFYTLGESPSSACLSCSIEAEVSEYSLFAWTTALIVFLACRRLASGRDTLLLALAFVLTCLLVDHAIFVSRVASWSTFTLADALAATISLSYLSIAIATAVFTLAAGFIVARTRPDNEPMS